MNNYDLTRKVIAIIIGLIFLLYVLMGFIGKKRVFNTKNITRIAIFSSISAVLYIVPYLKFSVPFFPAFLEIHFDEVPAIIAGYAYGPFVGFMVIFIKTIIKLPFTNTLCVGELTDFIYGAILVVISSFVYKRKRNIGGAILGFIIAMVVQLIVSAFFTTFVILDFYIFMMGFPKESILGMCQAINPRITNLGWPFFFMVALPFNAFKDVLIMAITFILYKSTHRIIDKIV